MSLSRILHLEPFIRLPIQYEVCTEVINICENHGKSINGDKFCGKCGSRIIEKEIEFKQRLHYFELMDNEHFVCYFEDESMYLSSNLYSFGFSTRGDEYQPITPEKIKSAIKKFKTKHKKDIQALEEKLGIAIEVEFGFLNEVW
jgi:hypothetical protein